MTDGTSRLRLVHSGDEGGAVATDELLPLVAQVLDGSESATETLVLRLTPLVLKVARSVLGSQHAEIEDVAQEAVLSILDALPRFRGESKVSHFAARVAVFTALAVRRKQKPQSELEELASMMPSPPDQMVLARRRALLRELCDELPRPQAEALVLHHALGYTVEEVASICQAPRNTVRSRLRLAKEAMRRRIDVKTYDELRGEAHER